MGGSTVSLSVETRASLQSAARLGLRGRTFACPAQAPPFWNTGPASRRGPPQKGLRSCLFVVSVSGDITLTSIFCFFKVNSLLWVINVDLRSGKDLRFSKNPLSPPYPPLEGETSLALVLWSRALSRAEGHNIVEGSRTVL